MPKEDRLITFNYKEVHKSVYTLCQQKGMKLPTIGEITDISQDPEDINRVYIDILENGTGPRKREEYSRDFVAAALLIFCRGMGIPMPKSARKSVFIKDGELGLRVRI